eukprot:CAMPEP_0184967248 /NCGR_PEP_ID=MMETSP1098-20130426/685_1 /TAXON_ID=89044 /ORGANISM="Spumella elongata, Strain CCAP 955/1" /LENGTH=857 /DNA_ID=CAMNT_0027488673 /DNA_START=80 /DNA_END=2653 /DNA_ORIENTATION=+
MNSVLEVSPVQGEESMEEALYDYEELEALKAKFETIVRAKEVDTSGDGKIDSVVLDDGVQKSVIPYLIWRAGNFNLLDQRIDRDDSQKVENNSELIAKFNCYRFENTNIDSSWIGSSLGYFLMFASGGAWFMSRRRTIPPGMFGHYISSSKHILTPPGIHTLISTSDHWTTSIVIDDEVDHNRKFGDKVILQVPENHLAGAYRIGSQGEDSRDQEFVLFSQGRHVLAESKYYGVCIVKLTTSNRMVLGPLTILYVHEGWLGGVVHRRTGVYRILYPGPPYLLHEADYEKVELVERQHDVFKVGPYEFVTVKDGQIAGTYRKLDGKFQILPPGRSYQLHAKDYSEAILIKRTKDFKLGPYFFLTVSNGEEAGVFRKKDGLFVRLRPGKTYQLNEDDFQKPLLVKRDSHVTKVGPLTLLTVEQGTLNGAYRVHDGKFVEFEDPRQEYVLHEREYHGLVTVLRNSTTVQAFGPFKVITVREGFVGQFEVEGKIDIKQAGYYKVESNVNIYDPIPVKMFQDVLADLDFHTKDGVLMSVKTTILWHVTNAQQVATFAGTFAQLQALVKQRAGDAMIRMCKQYNRGDLLPTAQDLEPLLRSGMSDSEANKQAEAVFRKLQELISETCLAEMASIAEASKLGITVEKVQIERFQLKNDAIMTELESITKAKLSANRERAQGEYLVVKADLEKRARERLAEANAAIALAEARAQAEVRRTQIETENHTKQAQSRVENEILKERNATAMQIEYDKHIKDAEAKAAAIRAITEAEYLKKVKECEAASHMPAQEFELKKMQLQVEMLREIGHAAWQYPDVYSGFLREFGDKLRIGPMSVSESLGKMALNDNKGDAAGLFKGVLNKGKD